MDCRVVVEAAIPVYDVETADEAVRIAISKTGEMLNPDLNYVEISMGARTSPDGEQLTPAFVVADEALVALELEMTVFNVEREEHAARIARKEIGQRLHDIPLKVLRVESLEEDGDVRGDGDGGEAGRDAGRPVHGTDAAEEELLPEFEEMVEDERERDR
ncbi:DUF555 domain-containing protein [Halobaculum lipolyticum]|uniref:UPF0212 protein ACFQL9_17110 n=1 Tax=Halobaculum lipolyticum TaxID=3032001 RepID=A0ABD5WHR9_9EURY|nr:DUF555 domain-containing protein [Halobaculum sp. DT31]